MTKSIYNKQNGRFEDEEANAGGAGTVSSVGLSVPSIFSIFGSPITSSGTMVLSLASQAANKFFAAPNGSAGLPSFRSIVGADISGAIGDLGGFEAAGSSPEIVTGSAVTEIQITDLDLNADIAYFGFFTMKAANSTNLTFWGNGGTTATNYYIENISASGTSLVSARSNNANILTGLTSSTYVKGFFWVIKGLDGFPAAIVWSNQNAPAALAFSGRAWIKNSTTNLTEFSLGSTTASGIDVGSALYMFKVL